MAQDFNNVSYETLVEATIIGYDEIMGKLAENRSGSKYKLESNEIKRPLLKIGAYLKGLRKIQTQQTVSVEKELLEAAFLDELSKSSEGQ